MVNRYIFKHGLSEEKILEIALDRFFGKAAVFKQLKEKTGMRVSS
jgi:hypothetical protein